MKIFSVNQWNLLPQVLLIAIFALSSCANEHSEISRAVTEMLAQPKKKIIVHGNRDSHVTDNVHFLSVVRVGKSAIPELINRMRDRKISTDSIIVIDAALIAIISGQPNDRIMPLGSWHRTLVAGNNYKICKLWIEWFENGCPLTKNVPGVTVPVIQHRYGWSCRYLKPPRDWPPTFGGRPLWNKAKLKSNLYLTGNGISDRIKFIFSAAKYKEWLPLPPPFEGELTADIMDYVLLVARGGVSGDYRYKAMELVAHTRYYPARKTVLLLLDSCGLNYRIPDALSAVGEPSDAIFLERAMVLRPPNPRNPFIWQSCLKALITLSAEDLGIAETLLQSGSPVAQAAGIIVSVRLDVIYSDELKGYIQKKEIAKMLNWYLKLKNGDDKLKAMIAQAQKETSADAQENLEEKEKAAPH